MSHSNTHVRIFIYIHVLNPVELLGKETEERKPLIRSA